MWERAGVHVSVHIRVRALVYPHACVPAHLWARALACPHAHACLCIGAVACMHARVCAHKARPCQISLPVTPRTRVCRSTRPAVAGDVFALTCPCPVPTVAVLPTLPGGLWVSPAVPGFTHAGGQGNVSSAQGGSRAPALGPGCRQGCRHLPLPARRQHQLTRRFPVSALTRPRCRVVPARGVPSDDEGGSAVGLGAGSGGGGAQPHQWVPPVVPPGAAGTMPGDGETGGMMGTGTWRLGTWVGGRWGEPAHGGHVPLGDMETGDTVGMESRGMKGKGRWWACPPGGC